MGEISDHNRTVVDQHTRQAEGYSRLTGEMSKRERPARYVLLGAKASDRVLDIACGPGSLTLELAPHVESATGLDLTDAMLAQARDAQQKSGAANVQWVQGDAAALPFDDGSFSLVTCSAAFHHFERPSAVLAEMARICANGGRIAVMDVTPDSSKTDAYDAMEKMRDPSHGHAHSLSEFTNMGRQLGLCEPEITTHPTPHMPYAAVLATSHPDHHTREELLQLMRDDAEAGSDRLGFNALLDNDEVRVSYPMSTVIWTKT